MRANNWRVINGCPWRRCKININWECRKLNYTGQGRSQGGRGRYPFPLTFEMREHVGKKDLMSGKRVKRGRKGLNEGEMGKSWGNWQICDILSKYWEFSKAGCGRAGFDRPGRLSLSEIEGIWVCSPNFRCQTTKYNNSKLICIFMFLIFTRRTSELVQHPWH